jgi:hypothetical protein
MVLSAGENTRVIPGGDGASFTRTAGDAFYDAMSAANELGMEEEAETLSKRLDHIKAVFRSQFS